MRVHAAEESERLGAAPVWRRRLLPLVLAVLLALALAACGSDDDDAQETSGASSEAFDGGEDSEDSGDFEVEDDGDAMEEETAAEEAMSDEEAQGGADSPAADDADRPLGAGGTRVSTAADLGRKLIFTAFVEVEVDDVAAASAEATSIIEGMGGFLFGQNTVGGGDARSELTFKVLPDDFNPALEALGSVGELRNQSVSTDDVTERIVDLGSRIEVAELGVTRLREALTGSQTLEDYAELERLLLDRESDLEVMRGQLRTLQDRVDLATITLTLTQERVQNSLVVDISSYEGHDAGLSCPGQGSSVPEGEEVTVCFDVINAGDQTLTNITLTDTVLEIGADNQDALIPVFGEIDELPPGQSALVAFEIRPERNLRLRTRAVAIPTDGVSSEPIGPSVSTQVSYEIRTFEPDRDPGFGDGFDVGVDIVNGLWVALKVVVGVLLIPVLVLGPILWLLWQAWRRFLGPRLAARRSTPPPPPPGRSNNNPPPPPPPAAPEAEPATPVASSAGEPSAGGGVE